MSKTLLIAFQGSDSQRAAAFGQSLGQPYDILVLNGKPELGTGASRLMAAGLSEAPLADALAPALAEIAKGYSHVAALTSMQAKDVLPRMAALMGAPMITDVAETVSATVFKRPVVAGSLVETVEVLQIPVVLTFRSAGYAFSPGAEPTPESVSLSLAGATKRIASSGKHGGRPDLSQARVVVSGGRPLKDAATFEQVIGGLADALGGAVGATRAAVDSGIAPNELQVGQTGKIVAPELYIAAGISGSTQHMAGIKDSKTIVAINTDAQAPIFEIADLGLVMDLYQAIPELRSKLG
ncbi:MAG: electron transfer flavoprotein subunit alpha/FixB family protein [Armatimonadetes bacterium]|nr:electron transfer flavoprotein subunit alpha/FixB family protein [Armatimonadota bacterium]